MRGFVLTIDEYLNQPRDLKRRRDQLNEELQQLETMVTSPRDSLNIADGLPGKSNGNAHETRLLKYIDTGRKFSAVNKQYKKACEDLHRAIDNLLYWQGSLILQVYYYNAYYGIDDNLQGADEILHTRSRGAIIAKLTESKTALADLLRAQGVEID